jgi:hypothetical protein
VQSVRGFQGVLEVEREAKKGHRGYFWRDEAGIDHDESEGERDNLLEGDPRFNGKEHSRGSRSLVLAMTRGRRSSFKAA